MLRTAVRRYPLWMWPTFKPTLAAVARLSIVPNAMPHASPLVGAICTEASTVNHAKAASSANWPMTLDVESCSWIRLVERVIGS